MFVGNEAERLIEGESFARKSSRELINIAQGLNAASELDRCWSEVQPLDDDPPSFEVFDETPAAGSLPPIPQRIGAPIALVPAAAGEEVLAVLGFGEWNACPRADVHIAILRLWRERWGAEVCGVSSDTLELTVARPPETFEEAVALAREQYGYANDIVDQGFHPRIGALASALVSCDHWHFWWD